MLKKLLIVTLAALTLFFTTAPMAPAHAQFRDWGDGCVDQNGIASLRCIPFVFGNIVYALLMFVGTVAVILLVYAGIKFITSGGDPKKVAGARQIITYALIGLVLVISSFLIIALISYSTGVECIRTFGFDNCG